MKWHVKRERAAVGRQMRSRDRPEGRGAAVTANLSRKSSSWSQVTGRAETLLARPWCLSGSSPRCPSYPSPAKILVVVCLQNVHVMLIGFVRWRVEGLKKVV